MTNEEFQHDEERHPMATKAEQFHTDEQRANRGSGRRKSVKRNKKSAWSRRRAHAGRKATHAFEDTPRGARRSRESTRGSANRAKSDAALNVTEEAKKGSPGNRARKARAMTIRARGSR
jgi:hypothetical protein